MVCVSSLGQPASIAPDGTYDWMSFLDDFVCGNEGLECLNFIGQDWLNPQPRPERDGGMVVPGVDDAFCKSKCDQPGTCLQISRPRTSDVFLFRSSFLGVGSLLDVDHQLSLRLFFVNWSGRIV